MIVEAIFKCSRGKNILNILRHSYSCKLHYIKHINNICACQACSSFINFCFTFHITLSLYSGLCIASTTSL